jgi:hypothetical protein
MLTVRQKPDAGVASVIRIAFCKPFSNIKGAGYLVFSVAGKTHLAIYDGTNSFRQKRSAAAAASVRMAGFPAV